MKKLDGSTLIETIIAMVIITIIFGFSAMIFSSVAGRHNPQIRSKAYVQFRKALWEKDEMVCCDTVLTYNDGFKIQKISAPYKNYTELFQLEIRVFHNANILLIDQKIIQRSKP